MSKRKIKQEVDLVLLFELISIGKRKTEQSNWYIFNEYRNWSEINQSNCTMKVGKVLERYYRRAEDSKGLRVIFGEYSDIVQTDILTIQRFLDISRFLYSGSWQVGWWRNTTDENFYEEAVIKIYVNLVCSSHLNPIGWTDETKFIICWRIFL